MATHPPTLVLGPEDHGRALSAEEFAEAECVGPWRYERSEGRLVVMAPDGYEHQATSEPWRDRLVVYKLQHPEVVEHLFSNPWIKVDDGIDRIGDLGVYLRGAPEAGRGDDRLPDLVFEVVSPGTESRRRDYQEKRADYQRLGIHEYVIVDRFTRRITVVSRTPGGYQERVLTVGDDYTSPLLPGLAIPLAEVL
jgi:Uma2 family endonuclease